jgi:hypothetical protein
MFDFDQTTAIVSLTTRNVLLGDAANQLGGLPMNQEPGNINQRQSLIVKSLSMMHSTSQITPSYPSKIYTPP